MFEDYKITIQDIEHNYFHFTSKNNLHSIEQNGLIPKIGKHAKFLEKTKKRQKWFPQFITDAYFGVLKKTKIYKKRAYKIFDKLLSESVLLKLDLKENIDFRVNDVDEIKSRNYKKNI